MKILVVSDSHGKHENLFRVFRKEKNYGAVLHLGDVEGGEEEIRRDLARVNPLAAFKAVPGNCDITAKREPFFVYVYEKTGLRIFMTHGHLYQVNRGTDLLLSAARRENCTMAFYGHTHRPAAETKDGVFLYNPGSIALPRGIERRPSYGILTIDGESGETDVRTVFI